LHAHAEDQQDHCDGIVERADGALRLGPTGQPMRAEDGTTYVDREGICIIPKSGERRVLAACPLGSHCVVHGPTRLCPESGECVELMKVITAKRKGVQK
jgi:hypothetical protein